MIELPNVTLICLTGKNYKTSEHLLSLANSCIGINFADVKLIQLPEIVDIESWNKAVIYELHKYFDTTHCLFVHEDGGVIHPELWKDEWLELDYIGSPWPEPVDNYSYRDEDGDIQRVGNSVGLRSKKLMNLIATREWKSYYGNTNEDGFIACHHRKWLEKQGCKFGTFEQALDFGKETELPEHNGKNTFLFHSIL